MLDYKLLAALAAVVEQGGFERAAGVLGLSQSAISQRIKLLEARLGAPVLVRANPPQATAAGQRLLNHVQQVRLLERDLRHDLPQISSDAGRTRLRVALNADSLATWWAGAVAPWCERERVLLDQQLEDQDVGLRRMRSGEVAVCLCAVEQPVAGARSLLLGSHRPTCAVFPLWCSARMISCNIGLSGSWVLMVSLSITCVLRPRALSVCLRRVLVGVWCLHCRLAMRCARGGCRSYRRVGRSLCRSTGITGEAAGSCLKG